MNRSKPAQTVSREPCLRTEKKEKLNRRTGEVTHLVVYSSIQQAGQEQLLFCGWSLEPGGGVGNMDRQQGRVGSQVGALWNTLVSF